MLCINGVSVLVLHPRSRVFFLYEHLKLLLLNASVNSKRQHPHPGKPLGFCIYFQPGSRDLYHLNCPGRTYYQSTKWSVNAA